MKTKTIKDLILKTEKIDWQKLEDLQPVNLKNNYHLLSIDIVGGIFNNKKGYKLLY